MIDCAIPQFGSCCCTCRWHVEDFHHCTTAWDMREQAKGCVCGMHKGWICMASGDRAHSGWSEHGMCEMHEPKSGDAHDAATKA